MENKIEILSEEEITKAFDDFGGYHAFCKTFGYLQFARKIEELIDLKLRAEEATRAASREDGFH